MKPNCAIFFIAILALQFSSQRAFSQDNVDESVNAVAVFNQAQELHERGELAKAIILYKKAIEIIPEFPEAEYQCGMAYQSLGKMPEAESALRRAVELRPDWTLALTSLGSILLRNGNFNEAESLLSRSIELDRQGFPALAAMAELRLSTKAPATVLRPLLVQISALTEKANPTAALWNARGALEYAIGNNSQAKLSFSKALAIDPDNEIALTNIGEIAIADGDLVKAGQTVSTLEQLAPNAASTKLLRARILSNEGKLAEAITVAESIQDRSPSAEEFLRTLRIASSTDPLDFEKLLENDPANVLALSRLCSLYRVDAPEKAIDRCQRAVEAEPNDPSHLIGLGAAMVQAKQFVQAIVLFRQILASAPGNSTVHANLALALFQLKRFAEAKVEYQWLVDNQPKLAVGYYFLGIAHDQLAEYLDAAANYQQFLRLADPVQNQLEIEKVNLRMPILQKQIKSGKGRKAG